MFRNRTFIITGASRGIGRAIALALASNGANIVIASKSVEENERLGGTIYSVAEEVVSAGGAALPIPCDIRDEDAIKNVVEKAITRFGAIDGLVNNASAITLLPTEQLATKRFDLMLDINVRGTFLMTKYCIPFLKQGKNPHILTLSPPLNITPKWLGMSVAYSISKFNMSMMTVGWSNELAPYGIAANSLWPVTTIATAAVKNLLGGEAMIQQSRTPQIMADAALAVLSLPTSFTGHLFTDEEILQKNGITDFTHYAISPSLPLQPDLFL